MNKVFLSGRITADVSRFGTDSKGGVMFTLVTSKPVIKDGKVQKDENGYTETYDQFHTVKAFGGLGLSSCPRRTSRRPTRLRLAQSQAEPFFPSPARSRTLSSQHRRSRWDGSR